MAASSKTKLIVVAGPTASGKSGVALRLAREFGGEIVGADSLQWLKGFDIGTAKPTPEELASVPHHLVDSRDPRATVDAAEYVKEARAVIADIAVRGRVPIVCGGTNLYIRALLGGLVELPGRNEAKRAEYARILKAGGVGALFARLLALAPEAAAHIDSQNPPRVVRALEVMELTGTPIWEWQAAHAFSERPYRALYLALQVEPERLRARIAERTALMLKAGLVEEVRELLRRYPDRSLKPYGSIGYREVIERLEGRLLPEDLEGAIAQATWRYAKKQQTWLRKEPEAQAVLASDYPAIRSLTADFLAEREDA